MKTIERLIEYGLYLFIFLLPWQIRWIWQDFFINDFVVEYGRFSLYGTQILLWLIFVLYGIGIFKTLSSRKRGLVTGPSILRKPSGYIYSLAVLFFIISGLSVFWAQDLTLALYRWVILVQGGALMAVVVSAKISFRNIAIVIVGSAIVQSVFAIGQFFSQYVFANKWLGLAMHFSNLPGSIILETSTERWLRAYGSLPHPNILAGFLAISFLFLIYLFLTSQNLKQRIFVYIGISTIVPALFFTFSRSAWLGFIFSLILFIIAIRHCEEFSRSKERRGNLMKFLALTVLIIAILSINLSGPLMTRLQGQQPLEVNSIDLRLTFGQQALQIISQSPWMGVGVGNYTLGVFNYISSTWPGYYYQPVHNIFLLIFAEVGVIGIAVFLVLIFLLLRQRIGSNNHCSLQEIVSRLSLVTILIISLFDHYFWTLEFGVLLFWLIVALNIKYLKKV